MQLYKHQLEKIMVFQGAAVEDSSLIPMLNQHTLQHNAQDLSCLNQVMSILEIASQVCQWLLLPIKTKGKKDGNGCA